MHEWNQFGEVGQVVGLLALKFSQECSEGLGLLDESEKENTLSCAR